ESSEKSCIRERFTTFFAVYSSDGGLQKDFPNDLNLVNMYRVIFNKLFDLELPLLPAKSFFVPWSDLTAIERINPKQLDRKCKKTANPREHNQTKPASH
ncbi:MAG: hypothetical protein V3U37_02645, partial [Nitrospinaceae bacterium]